MSSEKNVLFFAVCNNEQFESYRDFEIVLIKVSAAILAGWLPNLDRLGGVPLRRAGYLLDLLASWMWAENDSAIRHLVGQAKERLEPGKSSACFYHADVPFDHPNFDDLAVRWGLARGLPASHLMHILDDQGALPPTWRYLTDISTKKSQNSKNE